MPASDRWQSNAGHGCPAPRHHGLHAIINFIGLSAILAEIGPIKQTMNSYQNHEFIPPGRKTRIIKKEGKKRGHFIKMGILEQPFSR